MKFDKPTVSVAKEQRGDAWVVVTRNADGVDRKERAFNSKAEADAYWLEEIRRTKDQ